MILTFDIIVEELVPDDLHRKVEDDERNVGNGDDLDLLVQAVKGSVLLIDHSFHILQALLFILVGKLIANYTFILTGH